MLRLVDIFAVAVLLHAAWDGLNALWAYVIVVGHQLRGPLITIRRVAPRQPSST